MSILHTRDERAKLLRNLQAVSFAVNETNLYLDTHPTDANAKAYLARRLNDRQKAMTQYRDKYGALTVDDLDSEEGYTWIDTPMPWDNGGN